MLCTTVRENVECPFMTKSGCSYEGNVCKPIVPQCEGCARITEYSSKHYCASQPDPAAKWKLGTCNMATHVSTVKAEVKQKINPIKASKRGRG